jgi:pyridoxine 5-phosphate synthase
MIQLAVRLDDLIALRAAEPPALQEPAALASEVALGGGDRVVVRLNAERSPVRDRDLRVLRDTATCGFDVEIEPDAALVDAVLEIRPDQVILLGPGEGGAVEVPMRDPALTDAVDAFRTAGVPLAVVVEPEAEAVLAAQEAGLEFVRLDTGRFGRADTDDRTVMAYRAVRECARTAGDVGMRVHAGGALGPANARRIAAIPEVEQIVVGQAVAARAVFAGLQTAVRELKDLLRGVRVEGEE